MGAHLHKLSNIDEQARTGTCEHCGDDTPLKYRPGRDVWFCRNKQQEMDRERYQRPAIKRERRAHDAIYRERLKSQTADERRPFLAMVGYACQICDKPLTIKTARFDHDHSCCPGQRPCGNCLRGILCNGCNVGLGLLGDTPEGLTRALEYLRTRPQ